MRKISVLNIFAFKSPISCYWAGFVAADGNVSKDGKKFQLGVAERDVNHLKLFLSDISSNHKICTRPYDKFKHVTIRNSDMCNSLIENFNVTPNKSFTLSIPNLENRLLKHFIRGLFDGDGSVGIYNGRLHAGFCSASERCIVTVNEFFSRECGISSKISKAINTYSIQWSGPSAEAILRTLYNDSVRYLERKCKYAKL